MTTTRRDFLKATAAAGFGLLAGDLSASAAPPLAAGIVDALMRVKSNLDSGIAQAIQIAGIEALTASQDCVAENNATYQRRRDRLVAALNGIGLQV
ncbi:twin-arginine translocation signal domain-containing protein, partial [bacterium]|nr:twin-arginine translocation signal domain-containing protein [bacterium]